MDEQTRRQLAAAFSGDARQYADSRPPYPASAASWMVGEATSAVLDLGAGAGALTASLATAGHSVVAADPSASMIVQLLEGSRVPAVRAAAERLPFGDSAFDAVTVGTAFHWFDAERALPEVARVLRPAGVLALAWNSRAETSGIGARLGRLLRSAQPGGLQGDWATGSVTAVERSGLFTGLEYAEFPFGHRLTRQAFVGLVASRSYVAVLAESQRRALLDDALHLFDDAATSSFPEAAHEPVVELPYRTQCWRCRRRTQPGHG
jgi:SAM-dependent methyltransferase